MHNNTSRKICTTADGSHSVLLEGFDEAYHSRFGALSESRHVYINAGLHFVLENCTKVHVLEVGFGTGLNALLTMQEAQIMHRHVFYHTLEPYPLANEIFEKLNYPYFLNTPVETFIKLHTCPEDLVHEETPYFSFSKTYRKIEDVLLPDSLYNLIYFDAFAPDLDDSVWGGAVFDKLFSALVPGGVLVTYSTKGTVKRRLKEAGFTVNKLPGPEGKREICRAVKNIPPL